jgi:hypothetical protein
MTIRLYPAPPTIDGDAPAIPAHEQPLLRAAALHARRCLPGSLGELVARELTAYAEFGHRFATDGLVQRLAREVLDLAPGEFRTQLTAAEYAPRHRRGPASAAARFRP